MVPVIGVIGVRPFLAAHPTGMHVLAMQSITTVGSYSYTIDVIACVLASAGRSLLPYARSALVFAKRHAE